MKKASYQAQAMALHGKGIINFKRYWEKKGVNPKELRKDIRLAKRREQYHRRKAERAALLATNKGESAPNHTNVISLKMPQRTQACKGDVFGRLILPDLPDTVLIIPDIQAPYQHPDTLAFLRAVADFFEPDAVVCIGDELDLNMLSDFAKNPDLDSLGRELEAGQKFWQELFELFPTAYALHSNHGRGRLQKAQTRSGLITSLMPAYRDILQAPSGWDWYNEVRLGNVLFMHGDKEKMLNKPYLLEHIPSDYGRHYSVVHGHVHEKIGRQAEVNIGEESVWAAYTGCLVNPSSPAFGYTLPRKTKLGCGVIQFGEYLKIRMKRNDIGRWTGEL